MKRIVTVSVILSALLTMGTMIGISCRTALAGVEEPTIYVITKGDTLWGISEKFIKDPNYWPNLWAGNQDITNPHIIQPGQKVRIFPDRIELDESSVTPKKAQSPPPPAAVIQQQVQHEAKPGSQVQEVVTDRAYTVSGSEGFLVENNLNPSGYIISTYQNREMVGEDDIVYVDIGRVNGAKPGDRYSIYKKMGAISHPVSSYILGTKVIPLGTLQLAEVEEKVSKAIISKSYMEIGAASILLPYRDRRREVSLKAATKSLAGYIVDTQTGNNTISVGDVVFLDLGRKQGAEAGNMLYVMRNVEPDQKFVSYPLGKLPEDLIGAIVIVDVGENISTALVIKSIDTIYRGDRVELKKSK